MLTWSWLLHRSWFFVCRSFYCVRCIRYCINSTRCCFFFFFLNDPAPPEISTLPLHDALPLYPLAEPLDVERAAAREVPQRLLALSAAGEAAGAARHRLPLDAQHPRAAHRTALRQLYRPGVLSPPVGHHAHHFGDHIPGAAHHHGVSDPHVLAVHLVDVVQRDVAHRHAAHEHRREPRHRRERSGAADLELDEIGRAHV